MKTLISRNAHQSVPMSCWERHTEMLVVCIQNSLECLTFWPQIHSNPFLAMEHAISLICGSPEASSLHVLRKDGVMYITRVEHDGDVASGMAAWLTYHQWLAFSERLRLGSFVRVILNPKIDADLAKQMDPIRGSDLNGMDPYSMSVVKPTMIDITDVDKFKTELGMLRDSEIVMGFSERWVRRVALPVVQAWRHLQSFPNMRQGCEGAMEIMTSCEATDWKFACDQWLVNKMES